MDFEERDHRQAQVEIQNSPQEKREDTPLATKIKLKTYNKLYFHKENINCDNVIIDYFSVDENVKERRAYLEMKWRFEGEREWRFYSDSVHKPKDKGVSFLVFSGCSPYRLTESYLFVYFYNGLAAVYVQNEISEK